MTDSNSASTTFAATLVVQAPLLPTVTFYVSPAGSTTPGAVRCRRRIQRGTDGPFATFDAARAAVQAGRQDDRVTNRRPIPGRRVLFTGD